MSFAWGIERSTASTWYWVVWIFFHKQGCSVFGRSLEGQPSKIHRPWGQWGNAKKRQTKMKDGEHDLWNIHLFTLKSKSNSHIHLPKDTCISASPHISTESYPLFITKQLICPGAQWRLIRWTWWMVLLHHQQLQPTEPKNHRKKIVKNKATWQQWCALTRWHSLM